MTPIYIIKCALPICLALAVSIVFRSNVFKKIVFLMFAVLLLLLVFVQTGVVERSRPCYLQNDHSADYESGFNDALSGVRKQRPLMVASILAIAVLGIACETKRRP